MRKTTMDTCSASIEFTTQSALRIARGELACINNGRGVLIRVEHGRVWLTRANETTDVCLGAGESFRIDREGLTLISALGEAPFALVRLDPAAPDMPAIAQRVANLFRRLCGAGVRDARPRPATAAP
jgi:DUF2917 family protein